MAVKIEVNPIFRPELTEMICIPQDVFYYLRAQSRGEITAIRSLGNGDGAAVYYRENFFEDPTQFDYYEARRLFDRQNQIAHIMPWLSKALTLETVDMGFSEVVIQHIPDTITFTPVRAID